MFCEAPQLPHSGTEGLRKAKESVVFLLVLLVCMWDPGLERKGPLNARQGPELMMSLYTGGSQVLVNILVLFAFPLLFLVPFDSAQVIHKKEFSVS